MENDLKPCPFCGGDAEIITHNDNRTNEYFKSQDFLIGQCCQCGARSAKVHKKFLRDFTEHTVQDFRENPALRARVEEKYEVYEAEKMREATEAWNTRPAPTPQGVAINKDPVKQIQNEMADKAQRKADEHIIAPQLDGDREALEQIKESLDYIAGESRIYADNIQEARDCALEALEALQTIIDVGGFAVENGCEEETETIRQALQQQSVDVEDLKRKVGDIATYRGYIHHKDAPETYKLLRIGAEIAVDHLTAQGYLHPPLGKVEGLAIKALKECREVLMLCDPEMKRAKGITDEPFDSLIKEICEESGYGRTIDSAARQWQLKDNKGAFTSGPCVATVQTAIKLIDEVLEDHQLTEGK